MKGPSRNIIAAVLMAAYLLITVSPLAHLALRPATGTQAVIGECSGDCDICGCSPESRATHTCCCWQKRMKKHHENHDHEGGEAGSSTEKQSAKTVISCTCPCGSGKQFAHWGTGKFELLPYLFAGDMPAPGESSLSHNFQPRLTTRHGDPPDPPPKLSPFS